MGIMGSVPLSGRLPVEVGINVNDIHGANNGSSNVGNIHSHGVIGDSDCVSGGSSLGSSIFIPGVSPINSIGVITAGPNSSHPGE